MIPHYGTIVVGDGNQIGNYAVLHTSICITAGKRHIGDGLYCSAGSKIIGDINLGNYVTIGANAVVNRTFESNALLVGIPAENKRESQPWFSGGTYLERVNKCEDLKKQMGLF